VLLFHGGVSLVSGGFLGVEAFFVLSGFLITSLLVSEWRATHGIALGAFWARRARRLLPALFLMVTVVGLYYAAAGPPDTMPDLRGAGISTLLYVANWHELAAGTSYFAANGAISPFKHTWSLGIEEQFYLLWPLLLVGVFWLVRRRQPRQWRHSDGALRLLLALTVTGIFISAIETLLLFDGGKGLDRVYYGTDTRADSLLAGAALAIAFALRGQGDQLPSRGRSIGLGARRLGALAIVGMSLVLALMCFANSGAGWLYPGGLIAVDLAVVTVIAAVVLAPETSVPRALSATPLRAIGVISYGVYLWHYPLFLWLDDSSTGLSGIPLLVLRIAITLAISTASFVLLEQPIRRGKVPKPIIRTLAPLAAGVAVLALVVGSAIQTPGSDAAAAPPPPKNTARFTGISLGCRVYLQDTPQYGLVPLPPNRAAGEMYGTLRAHSISWHGAMTATFHTCPPDRVLLVGDSLAYSLGVGLMDDEVHYGIEVANAAMLGCAFTTAGELNIGGQWQPQSNGCPDALDQWSRDVRTLGARAVIVELGYRDQFDWMIGGAVVHLGQRWFDQYVQGQIDRYVQVLSATGAKVVLLTVPYTNPPANADGSPAAAAAPARHQIIDSMLYRAASGNPNVSVVNIDRQLSPHNHYQATIDGQLCRFDGIHFTTFCSQMLQPTVLDATRQLIGR
jgi:peptidoglycan/LPS O-acetylase OafA/YrhL